MTMPRWLPELYAKRRLEGDYIWLKGALDFQPPYFTELDHCAKEGYGLAPLGRLGRGKSHAWQSP